MAMRVDKPRKQRFLTKIDDFLSWASRGDLRKISNIDNLISGNRDRAILNRRPIHCDHYARTNDHASACSGGL
jgi:hypothetical protein